MLMTMDMFSFPGCMEGNWKRLYKPRL